jgi:hypothetical protein
MSFFDSSLAAWNWTGLLCDKIDRKCTCSPHRPNLLQLAGIDNKKFGHDCPMTLPLHRNVGCGQTLGLHGFITGKSIAFKFIEKYYFNFIDSTALLF